MTANRWAIRNDTLPPNPGAGFAWGRPRGTRPEASMATSATAGAGPTNWHPTVANLLVLVVLEFAAYAALRYFFRSAHGG